MPQINRTDTTLMETLSPEQLLERLPVPESILSLSDLSPICHLIVRCLTDQRRSWRPISLKALTATLQASYPVTGTERSDIDIGLLDSLKKLRQIGVIAMRQESDAILIIVEDDFPAFCLQQFRVG